MDDIEVKNLGAYEAQLLRHFESNHAELLAEIGNGKKMSNDLQVKVKAGLEAFGKRFDPNAS